MFDVRELADQVNRLKAGGGCVGNNFLTLSALTEFSKQETSALSYNEDAIALICEDVGVTRLHFYLSSLEAAPSLKELLETVPRRPIIADCVGREEQLEPLSRVLCKEGFSLYTRMGRLRGQEVIVCPDMTEAGEDVYAGPEDTDEILSELQAIFDPFVSHLPDRDRLLRLIEQKLVLRVKDGEKIAAVACMERVGKRGVYCYQVFVSPEQRGKGYGRLIYRIAADRFRGCRPYTTWVEDSNTQVLKIWGQFGFLPDGLRDTILIYR